MFQQAPRQLTTATAIGDELIPPNQQLHRPQAFANFTTEQLEFLSPSISGFARDPESRHRIAGLETIAACCDEYSNRARALRELVLQRSPKSGKTSSAKPAVDPIPGDASRVAALLDSIADPNRRRPAISCLASALYMRDRRIGVLGCILDLVAAHPTVEFAWLTARESDFQFTATERWSEACRHARDGLQRRLQACNAVGTPGLLAAYLHGFFDPTTGKFGLKYRGIVAGEKLNRIRKSLQPNPKLAQPRPTILAVHPIRDLPQQILRMMPNSLTEVAATAAGMVANATRMREPYHSLYLMWLAQHSLADLLVIDGAYYCNGRLVMSAPAVNKSRNRGRVQSDEPRHLPESGPSRREPSPATHKHRQAAADHFPGL
jgi:hypothetical protein